MSLPSSLRNLCLLGLVLIGTSVSAQPGSLTPAPEDLYRLPGANCAELEGGFSSGRILAGEAFISYQAELINIAGSLAEADREIILQSGLVSASEDLIETAPKLLKKYKKKLRKIKKKVKATAAKKRKKKLRKKLKAQRAAKKLLEIEVANAPQVVSVAEARLAALSNEKVALNAASIETADQKATADPSCLALAGNLPLPGATTVENSYDEISDLGELVLNRSYLAYCKPKLSTFSSLWGTFVYTDDSSLCLAAAHAGVLSLVEGGNVNVKWIPGQESYLSSDRNGLQSSGYSDWEASIVFVSLNSGEEVRD